MKAARWHGLKDMRVDDIPVPGVRPGTVKIKVKWCGICGSDLHEYTTGPVMVPIDKPHPLTKEQAPVVFGHEFSGEVVEVGEGVTKYKAGDRVVVEPIYNCGKCPACRSGKYNRCEMLGFYGVIGGGGGFSEYTVTPEKMVHKIPDNMTFEQGALVEPTAVAVHAVRKSKLRIGDSVAVFGTGPIGLLTIMAAKAAGAARVIAVEVSQERKQYAAKVGADIVLDPTEIDVVEEIHRLTGGGVDISFEVAGIEEVLNQAIDSVKFDGQVVVISVWEQRAAIDPNKLLFKECDVIGTIGYCDIFPGVIKLIADGRIKADELVTKKIDIDNVVSDGLEALLAEKNQIKILVKPD
ncbi:2,3-butanediol dehydrogenase [Numidum massiliense]|uniref:2,3-butanediol dehydrogenase n=1 Tax=Numidum massiliense TaxID=1522315 RepID=UPI0006D55F7A|nr:2,3-butanediol dehydrogenase [Numidum massiliense]